MLSTNQVLHKGRYRIINSFGQDETGGIYDAYDTISNTNVVLRESVGKLGKVATSSQLEEINSAFAGGAKALKDIKHESIVSVQDFFSEIDRQYIVLEAATGLDLTKFLKPAEPKPALVDVLSWADQLLNALNYLHRLVPPFIHQDISPANIKLTSTLKVKLLTAHVATPPPSGSTSTGSQTEGTAFNYKPLEQLWAGLDSASQRVILNSYDEKSAGVLLRPMDARTDLYSVAASLYHLLTGILPADALDRSIAILDGKPDPLQKPAEVDATIPPEISDVFMRALALRRENRFDSATIMQQVLRTSVVRVEERRAEEAEAAKNAPASLEKEEAKNSAPFAAETKPMLVAKNSDPHNENESAESRLEQERNRAEERQRELEIEQDQLDEEQNRIAQRQQELEEAKKRHLAERERLELEAEQSRLRAEQERKRIEKERLEQEIEKERQRFGQKLLELETEQVRQRAEEERLESEAEEERKRIAQRMLELRAEQERKRQEKEELEKEAEQERLRAAQKLAELEAEKERRRAEDERLEHEAEAERTRAEERLKELLSEQEHYRAEQKRIEAEAQKERELAEQRLKELSDLKPDVETPPNGIDQKEEGSKISVLEDDQFLLELEPHPQVSEFSFAALDSRDEASFTEVNTAPKIGAYAIAGGESMSINVDDTEIEEVSSSHAFSKYLPIIAGSTVLLLIILVAAWKLMLSEPVEDQTSAPAKQNTMPPVQEGQPPYADAPAVATQEKPSSASITSADDPTDTNDSTKQLQLNATPAKQKKNVAVASKTPPAKKKVTVDDLINDN
ncbi:MAG: protein kinase [Pyrinomonadaceae bacterium]